MNYHQTTHCPNCFKSSPTAICSHCNFDRDKYLKEHASNHHLPLFTRLDKGYVIGRVLGEGGFAIVYAALREADGLAFAVKEYYPESLASRGLNNCTVQAKRNETERLAVWQKRFKEEAEHLRRCQDYPAIAGVVKRADLLEQNNTVYLVMERLQGNSLRDFLTEPKSAQWILGWLKPLLATFEQLHNRQIFHRDVSPNNVFLTAENQPVLMDFGLAREGIRDSALKSSTVGAGTEGFIAPEQTMAAASSRVDARTDLYSLGGLVYMALHGELPPSAGQRAQGAQLKRCQNADGVTAQLEAMALHCLALDRDKRPENVAAIKRQYALLWQEPKPQNTIIPDRPYSENKNQQAFENEKKQARVESQAKSTFSFKSLLAVGLIALMGWLVYANKSKLEPAPVEIPATLAADAAASETRQSFEPEIIKLPTGIGMGKYEVTIEEYMQCVNEKVCRNPEWLEKGSEYNINTGSEKSNYATSGMSLSNKRYPITGVSWDDTQKYLAWLNGKTNKNYCLPTEEEWFAACQADKSTEYSDFDKQDEVAWYLDNSGGTTHAVGQKTANAWDLNDMSGNVWEWTSSYENKVERVLRGGAFSHGGYLVRCAARGSYSPVNRFGNLGFRVALCPHSSEQ